KRVTREMEIKLEAINDDLHLTRERPELARTGSKSTHQATIFYDSHETGLKKHGFTLRVRSIAGKFVQPVKSITEGAGLVSREEVECDVTSLKPDLGCISGHPIRSLLGRKKADRLEPVIHSDVNRTSWIIDRHNDTMQVDLDHGTITAGEHCEEFAELEFELR